MKNRIVKVIAWRCLSILITFLTIFFVTGDIKSTTGLTVLLHILLITFHFIFECLWDYKLAREDSNYEQKNKKSDEQGQT